MVHGAPAAGAARASTPTRPALLVGSLRGMSLLEVESLLRRLLGRAMPSVDDAFMAEVLGREGAGHAQGGHPRVRAPRPRRSATSAASTSSRLWVRQRASLFTPQARAQGLPRPKGILLMGMSGCGKSLAVKVIATEWKLPLFRLDMNLVFAGVHGSPEWVFHRALEAVEAVAPAVLWIDEIEMGVGGYHEGADRLADAHLLDLPDLDAGAPRPTSSWPPPPTASTCCRPRSSARAASTRCSSSSCPTRRSARRSSPSTCAASSSTPASTTSCCSPRRPAGWNGAEIEQAVISARIACHADQPPGRAARPAARDGADRPAVDDHVRADQGDPLAGRGPAPCPPPRRAARRCSPSPHPPRLKATGSRLKLPHPPGRLRHVPSRGGVGALSPEPGWWC